LTLFNTNVLRWIAARSIKQGKPKMNKLLTLSEVGTAVQRGRTGIYALIKSEQAFLRLSK
jgi:hypothetical protein